MEGIKSEREVLSYIRVKPDKIHASLEPLDFVELSSEWKG